MLAAAPHAQAEPRRPGAGRAPAMPPPPPYAAAPRPAARPLPAGPACAEEAAALAGRVTPPPDGPAPYEVLGRISAGGMAEVFRARRRSDGRPVAIKRLLPILAAEPEFVRMFADEARIASQLSHPGIARVLDVARDHCDGSWYMAQELVEGPDLRDVLARARQAGVGPTGPMPVSAAVLVAMEVADALGYAHDRIDPQGRPLGLIHRDVSPQNILVDPRGQAKLVDFGICKAEHREARTRTGFIKGKFSYMSPEQARGVALDARTDIFSLGSVLFELLTGHRLFDAGNDVDTLERVRRAIVPAPSTLNPEIPDKLDRVVLSALSRSRRARPQTARELRDALAPFLGPGGAHAARRALLAHIDGLTPRRRSTPPPPPPPPAGPAAASAGADDSWDDVPTRRWTPSVGLRPALAESAAPAPPRRPASAPGPTAPARRPFHPVLAGLALAAASAVLVAGAVLLVRTSAGGPRVVAVPPATIAAPQAAVTAAPIASEAPAAPEPPAPAAVAPAPPPALSPRPVAAPAPARTLAARPARRPAPALRTPVAPVAPVAPVVALAPPPPAVAAVRPTPRAATTGWLNLNARPWARVWIDGREVGETPLYRHRLPEGRHRATLVNDGFGVRRELAFRIDGGETTPLMVDLD